MIMAIRVVLHPCLWQGIFPMLGEQEARPIPQGGDSSSRSEITEKGAADNRESAFALGPNWY